MSVCRLGPRGDSCCLIRWRNFVAKVKVYKHFTQVFPLIGTYTSQIPIPLSLPIEMNTKNSLRGRKSGFTLIEILLVLGLIGLLVSVVVINAGSIFGNQQESMTELKVKESLTTPLFSFKSDMGNYPTTEQGLKALVVKPANDRGRWRGPYVKDEESLRDAWQNELKYRFPGVKNPGGYDLYSLGPDGTESGDDIGNWK